MAKKYLPAKGAGYNAAQAKALGRVLEQLGEHVTPQQVVDAARPARSPIHKLFDWRDTEAAEKWRLFQARNHINHLEIVIEVEGKRTETRAYHSIVIDTDEGKHRGYAHMADVRKSASLSAQVVAKALAELEGWKKRYAKYGKVFGEVFEAIERVKQNGHHARNGRKTKAVA